MFVAPAFWVACSVRGEYGRSLGEGKSGLVCMECRGERVDGLGVEGKRRMCGKGYVEWDSVVVFESKE